MPSLQWILQHVLIIMESWVLWYCLRIQILAFDYQPYFDWNDPKYHKLKFNCVTWIVIESNYSYGQTESKMHDYDWFRVHKKTRFGSTTCRGKNIWLKILLAERDPLWALFRFRFDIFILAAHAVMAMTCCSDLMIIFLSRFIDLIKLEPKYR